GVTLDSGPAADERVSVECLELVEARAVDDPCNQLACVELRAMVVGNEPVKIAGIDRGRLGARDAPGRLRWPEVRVGDDAARDREGVLVARREVVGDAGLPGVHVRASEL